MKEKPLALSVNPAVGNPLSDVRIVALEKPTSGHVIYQGESLSDMPFDRLRKIRTQIQVMMFQNSYSSL